MGEYCATIRAHLSHFEPKCCQTFDKKRLIVKGLTGCTLYTFSQDSEKSEGKFISCQNWNVMAMEHRFIDIEG